MIASNAWSVKGRLIDAGLLQSRLKHGDPCGIGMMVIPTRVEDDVLNYVYGE